jgi:hypothetical protein
MFGIIFTGERHAHLPPYYRSSPVRFFLLALALLPRIQGLKIDWEMPEMCSFSSLLVVKINLHRRIERYIQIKLFIAIDILTSTIPVQEFYHLYSLDRPQYTKMTI